MTIYWYLIYSYFVDLNLFSFQMQMISLVLLLLCFIITPKLRFHLIAIYSIFCETLIISNTKTVYEIFELFPLISK